MVPEETMKTMPNGIYGKTKLWLLKFHRATEILSVQTLNWEQIKDRKMKSFILISIACTFAAHFFFLSSCLGKLFLPSMLVIFLSFCSILFGLFTCRCCVCLGKRWTEGRVTIWKQFQESLADLAIPILHESNFPVRFCYIVIEMRNEKKKRNRNNSEAKAVRNLARHSYSLIQF